MIGIASLASASALIFFLSIGLKSSNFGAAGSDGGLSSPQRDQTKLYPSSPPSFVPPFAPMSHLFGTAYLWICTAALPLLLFPTELVTTLKEKKRNLIRRAGIGSLRLSAFLDRSSLRARSSGCPFVTICTMRCSCAPCVGISWVGGPRYR